MEKERDYQKDLAELRYQRQSIEEAEYYAGTEAEYCARVQAETEAIVEQVLSQKDGNRWEKMQAVVEAAKEFEHDLCFHEKPDTNLWTQLRRALADLEGGGE